MKLYIKEYVNNALDEIKSTTSQGIFKIKT